MRLQSVYLLAGTALLITGAMSAQSSGTSAVHGYWETPDGTSIVRLQPCETASGALCGHVVWLAEGEPRTDANNPDRELRDREIVGLSFLTGFQQEEQGVWTGGEVYNPEDGRTYRGSIEQTGPNTLELEGCALRIFCKTQEWERTGPDDPRLAGGEGG